MGRNAYFSIFVVIIGTSFILLFSTVTQSSQATGTDVIPLNEIATNAPEIAKTFCHVTGIAIQPVFATCTLGAWEYFSKDESERKWYASPWIWIPGILVLLFFVTKDIILGFFPLAKKPLDAFEVFLNKAAAIVAILLVVVPVVLQLMGIDINFFKFSINSMSSKVIMSAIPLSYSIWSNVEFVFQILAIAISIYVFVVVWLAFHALNVIILLNPFGIIDIILKGIKFATLLIIIVSTLIHPYLGAFFSIIVLFVAIKLAGWAFRLSVFGSIFAWDLLTLKHRKYRQEDNCVVAFASRRLAKVKTRSYGHLLLDDNKALTFSYRPWLIFRNRTVRLPETNYVIGKGLISPMLICKQADSEKTITLLSFPPRYRLHELEIAKLLGIESVEDAKMLKGFKGAITWFKDTIGKKEKVEISVCEKA